tara:strand:+ start:382 stop:990 length:609 start_codon:yes stop_codon:yes gene_type:complete
MAIHVEFNTNHLNLTLDQGFQHIQPDNIHTLFTDNISYTEDELIELVSLIKPTIQTDNHDKKHYWIRYLLCCGRANDVINEFNLIYNNFVPDVNINDFLNSTHEDFNNNTILHHVVRWCPNIDIINTMIDYGAQLDIEDNNGDYAEENVSNTLWYNPFARIFDMDLVFGETIDNRVDTWYIRNPLHFDEVINHIRIMAGEDI